jgi:NAD(P)-dependent dehydrogenase (short-subunit alcohol dehydrogenase family)
MKEFKGKVAVINGASGSIGRALAERCAKEGMKVIIADIDKKSLDQTEKDLKAAGASVLAVKTDVSKADDLEALAKKTIDTFGAVHLLCNTGGIYIPTTIRESKLDDWRRAVDVNLWGAIYSLRAFLPIMLKQNTECHIINTTPVLGGFYALPYNGPYNVSQYGIVTLFETLSIELDANKSKVRVSLLSPDYADAEIVDPERQRPTKEMGEEVSSHFEKVQEIIRATVRAETPPQRLAEIVFEAIKKEKFYILPHPGSKFIIHDRMERALQARNPENILKLTGLVS